MKNQKYDWKEFYQAFAKRLLDYKDDRSDLIDKVKRIYSSTGIKLPTLERDNQMVDIDPFTVFGLFNKSQMREENRIKIITAIADIFGLEEDIPTSFDSLPVLNNLNATFYTFIDEREDNAIDDLWGFFEAALRYADDPSEENRKTFFRYFDIAINIKGNGNSKITMALYWIAPSSFLNLDSRNKWYIYESERMPISLVDSLPKIEEKMPSGDYLDVVEKLHQFIKEDDTSFRNFKDLSLEAWRYSEEVNEMIRAEKAKSKRDDKGSALADEDVDIVHYWLYSPGDSASKWEVFYDKGIMGIGWGVIGDLNQYNSKDEMKAAMKEEINPAWSYMNAAHATWQFANEMKPGDIIFAKKGMSQLVGRGIVTSDYFFDESGESEFHHFREVNWIDKGLWEHPGKAVVKTLTDITPYTDYVAKLNALFETDEEDEVIGVPAKTYSPYGAKRFLEEVYMDEDQYHSLVSLLRDKRNVILQGAPGVGKTFAAKRLAYSMMGVKDPDRVMMVQFHQSYSYEDFIEGFRPSSEGEGFIIKKGSFYEFCKTAEDDIERDYFFIIDEINRGNLSKIFGELMVLIENDKRGNALRLLYSDERFSVPKNVYIIGMMNTADRSLAMLDFALRRRFAFYDMKPAFNSEGFQSYKNGKNSEAYNRLIRQVERLNVAIYEDDTLGENYAIGHSYFHFEGEANLGTLSRIVEYEIIPLLKEYWFDEPSKVNDWSHLLRSSVK